MKRTTFMQHAVMMAALSALPVSVYAATGDNTTSAATLWQQENSYWQSHYTAQPYSNGTSYSTYEPAYRYGTTIYSSHTGTPYIDLDQAQLRTQWEQSRGNSNLSWDQAQPAVRDAYTRLYDNRNAANGSMNNMAPAAGGKPSGIAGGASGTMTNGATGGAAH